MMIANAHTHTNFCDGSATVLEMAAAAYERGFSCLGYSGHSVMPFETGYAMSKESVNRYVQEILQARELYRGKMDVICGLELDLYSQQDTSRFEYLIGGVHYLYDRAGGLYYAVDGTKEELLRCIREAFGGDALKMCAAYYENMVELAERRRPDIIAHFDLVRKLSDGKLFDEHDSKYLSLAYEAATACLKHEPLIEVNWGAVYRGYCRTPYPDIPILKMFKELGARMTFGADAHEPAALDFGLRDTLIMLSDSGFKEMWTLTGEGFIPQPLDK